MKEEGFNVTGLDSGFFKTCIVTPIKDNIPTLHKDIRDVEKEDFRNFDVVIHLAALSNDPIGELDSKLTFEINYEGAVRVAQLAKEAGVKRFVFVSTQSIYGISTSDTELDEIDSVKNPQTAYAQSKWNAEQEILAMSGNGFATTALRPSTVFGWSPRLRSDIVFNNLILNGLVKQHIEVHSDGSPWRPIIHVQDVCVAIQKCVESNVENVESRAFNLGVMNGNYTVKELAEAAQVCLDGIPITFNTENLTDPRSYKVSFERAHSQLDFAARIGLLDGGHEIAREARKLLEVGTNLLDRKTNRLNQVKYLLENGSLDDTLRFR
jgi:nucleoside-diphosphate-sugar epimerase